MNTTHRYLFLFTYGRSGSTLLSGYLNSLPGCCVRGENYMALAGLIDFYRSVQKSLDQRAKTSNSPVHPWYGVDEIDLNEVRRGARDLFTRTVLNPGADDDLIGCKEIRIQPRDLPDFDGFLDSLLEIFCEVKFVFNHRRLADTAKSKWWRDTAHSHAMLRAMDDRLRFSRHAGSERVFHVQYEDLIGDPRHAEALTQFLNKPFDMRRYREVLDTRHSY